jgi:uncharacterized protein YcsI (UPF0317 family)
MNQDISPRELRHKIRSGEFTTNTSGYSPGYVQGNLCILPADYANEFLQFCQANPRPCPLIGMASSPGDYHIPKLGEDLDIRSDVPSYRVFENGKLVNEVSDISDLWRGDLVSFVLGCSFSFEEALIADGLEVRNVSEGVNVPMYRTNIDCASAGRFSGKMVVSMRPMLPVDAIRAIQICTYISATRTAAASAISPLPTSAMPSPVATVKYRCSGPAA